MLEVRHRGADGLRDVECVRRRQRLDTDTDGRTAVETDCLRIVLGAEFDAADVFEADIAAVGKRSQEQIPELLRRGKAPDGTNVDVERLIVRGRCVADAAGGDLHVLLTQRVDDVVV